MLLLALLGSAALVTAFGLWWFSLPLSVAPRAVASRPDGLSSPLELVLPHLRGSVGSAD